MAKKRSKSKNRDIEKGYTAKQTAAKLRATAKWRFSLHRFHK